MDKNESVIHIVFVILGIIVFGIGISVCCKQIDYTDTAETTAIITDIDSYYEGGEERHTTYVKYTVDGQEIQTALGWYSSTFEIGDEIEIYYYLDDPTKTGVKGFNSFLWIMPAAGLVFVVFGGLGLILKIKAKRRRTYIINNGTKVEAKYLYTRVNTSYLVNGKHPYVIYCEWIDPSTMHAWGFKSENIWDNPEGYIEQQNITTFPVYLDINNPKNYAVDVDIITKYR